LLIIKKGLFENPIIAFLFIFPFIKVNAFPYRNVQIVMIIGVFVFFLIEYVLKFKKFSHFAFWALLFSLSVMMSTWLKNGQYLLNACFYVMRITAFFLVFDVYLSQKKYIILSVTHNYLGVLFGLNLFFQIWQQDYWGYTDSNNFKNFFIDDNALPFYAIVLIALIVIKSIRQRVNAWDILKIVIAYLSLVKAWCASGLIAVTICLILIVFYLKNILKFQINLKLCALFIAAIHLALIFGNSLIESLDEILIQLFNKTIAHSRLLVWRSAVQNISHSLIWGYGTTEGGRQSINYVGNKHWYSHNFVLEYLIQGGVVLLAVYMLLVLLDIKQLDKCESKTRALLCCVFLGQHIAFLTEGSIMEPIEYLIYILIFFSFDISKNTV